MTKVLVDFEEIPLCEGCGHPAFQHRYADPPNSNEHGDYCMVDCCPCFDGEIPEDYPEYEDDRE